MKETDLYLPLKKFLEKQGYEVKAEVENCDVVAVKVPAANEKAQPATIIELKLSLNLEVILQAVDRLTIKPARLHRCAEFLRCAQKGETQAYC